MVHQMRTDEPRGERRRRIDPLTGLGLLHVG